MSGLVKKCWKSVSYILYILYIVIGDGCTTSNYILYYLNKILNIKRLCQWITKDSLTELKSVIQNC